jgi:hypothetical protein
VQRTDTVLISLCVVCQEAAGGESEAGAASSEPMPTPAAAPIEPIEVGEEIECTWGAGIIKEVRTDTLTHTKRRG